MEINYLSIYLITYLFKNIFITATILILDNHINI